MFTEQQLKAAHAKVKSGADFPAYIQEIKGLGLLRYEYFVADGHTEYFGADNYHIKSDARYAPLIIADQSSAVKLEHTIAIHQQGQTDFMTFCRQAAETGVEKWVIDTQKMLCTYYDKTDKEMVAEPIPNTGYEQQILNILKSCVKQQQNLVFYRQLSKHYQDTQYYCKEDILNTTIFVN